MKINIQRLMFFIRIRFSVVIESLKSCLWYDISSDFNGVVNIHDDFFGINIATSEDAECDDYVIEQLHELGIKHVRMHFSYDSVSSYGERLLNRVLSEDIDVLLTLLPPRNDARVLLDDKAALDDWREFVSGVFERYHDTVSIFEIGNASNRKKWSGYQLDSFLLAWREAYSLARTDYSSLAGPNVSDFEPLYNIAFLKTVKKLGRVPKIHTDNLFVERVVEPEAFDHRVLGLSAGKWLKLNLIKKARILDAIGKKFGCEQTFATYQCWTIKRLSRWSDKPEKKQADYLSRYLILAAASNALNRVYWGPLICGRDGLIDDGSDMSGYPEIDNVSYYKCVRGEVTQFQLRPAFFALKFVRTILSNTSCIQGTNGLNGVSHFVFTHQGGNETHVAWCRDGVSVASLDIYPNALSKKAKYYNNCGEELGEMPANIDEQPLFICFPVGESICRPDKHGIESLNSLESLISRDNSIHSFSNNDWQGSLMVASTSTLSETSASLLPEVINQVPELKVLRDKRNKIWNIDSDFGRLTIKLNRSSGVRKIGYYFKSSKAKRHWDNAVTMLTRGVNTPVPYAYFDRHNNSGIEDSYYITEFIEDAFSARDVFASINKNEGTYRGVAHSILLEKLAQFICNLHDNAIIHRDLSSGNILFTCDDAMHLQLYFIDIGRAKVVSELSARQRLIDLMRICYKLSWPAREEFMGYYNRHLGYKVSAFWRCAVRYFIFKQQSKRFIKGLFKVKR